MFSIKKIKDKLVISKSTIPTSRALNIVDANKRIETLTAENESLKASKPLDYGKMSVAEIQAVFDEQSRQHQAYVASMGYSDTPAIKSVVQTQAAVSIPRTLTPNEILREKQEARVKDKYFAEQTRLIDRDERNAKSAYANYPDKLAQAMQQASDARAKLERERAEVNKPVGFDQKSTPVSDGSKFYYIAPGEYYIAMLSDGRVVCKQSGEYGYRRLVQNTLSTPGEVLGTYSYPELTAEMFEGIIKGKPTYTQLNDVYKIQATRERIVLDGSQAKVIW
jgi:hypothetical protein